MDRVWPVAQAWLRSETAFVRDFIKSPPQTNETRRSIILLPGFLNLAARFKQPLHLLELGASAGLNQNWDKFNYYTDSWQRSGASDEQGRFRITWPATVEPRIIVVAEGYVEMRRPTIANDGAIMQLVPHFGKWRRQINVIHLLDDV